MVRVSPLAAAVSVIDGAVVASNAVSAPKMKEKFRAEYRMRGRWRLATKCLAPISNARRPGSVRISRLPAGISARRKVRATTHGVIPAVRDAESPEISGWSPAIKSLLAIAFSRSRSPDTHTLSQVRGEK